MRGVAWLSGVTRALLCAVPPGLSGHLEATGPAGAQELPAEGGCFSEQEAFTLFI